MGRSSYSRRRSCAAENAAEESGYPDYSYGAIEPYLAAPTEENIIESIRTAQE